MARASTPSWSPSATASAPSAVRAENRVRGRALGSGDCVDRQPELRRRLSPGKRLELRADGVGPTSYGKEQDQLTDLSYYGARYFDPLSLTWTQADPLYRFAPEIAWSQPRRSNAYAFALNNPLRYFDSDGLSPLDMHRDLVVPDEKQREGINRVMNAINASSSSDRVRAQTALPFLALSVGLSPSSLSNGLALARGLQSGPKGAWAVTQWRNGRPVQLDFDFKLAANVSSSRFDLVWALSVMVHERVHVEGDLTEWDAYRSQAAFLRMAHAKGGISDDELEKALEKLTSSMHDILQPAKTGKVAQDVCEECLKYGLNPYGYWGLRSSPAQLDRVRGPVP